MPHSEIYVAEYSPSQDAFHVETLNAACLTNARMMLNPRGGRAPMFNSYITLFAGTYDECHKFINAVQDKIRAIAPQCTHQN